MGYPVPGTYMSPYNSQPGYGPPAPYYGPPPQYPPQSDGMGGGMLALMMGVLLTMPNLQNAATVANQLKADLAALTPPPAINAQPTAPEYNALLNYAVAVKNKTEASLASQGVTWTQFRSSLVTALVLAMATGGGGMYGMNPMMMMVLVLAFSNGALI